MITTPMLANNAEPGMVEYMLASDSWVMQPKVDGDRVMIEVIDGVPQVWGRSGQPKVSNLKSIALTEFEIMPEGRFVFDGEIVERTLWLFDLPYADGIVENTTPFVQRFGVLQALVDAMGSPRIEVVSLAIGEQEKRDMLLDAEINQREGVMFRRGDSRYVSGRATSLLKHKFVKTMDCVVLDVGMRGHDNARLGVYDHDGKLVAVGAASTIGKNKANGGIKVNQVVEVRFLYVLDEKNPRLYQPRIVKVRTDKLGTECSVDQLIGATTNKMMR